MFVWSFAIAVIGVGMILFLVDNARSPRVSDVVAPSDDANASSGYGYEFVALAVAATALSVVTISDAFLYLLIQRQLSFSTGLFPLLFVGSAAAYFVFAIPAGRLADRVGRRTSLLCGYLLLAAAYALITRPGLDMTGAVVCLLLLGAYYALTDGVLMALVSNTCRPQQRATAMAAVGTLTSAGRFVASLAFGALWTWYGEAVAVRVFMIGLAVAVALAWVILTIAVREGRTR